MMKLHKLAIMLTLSVALVACSSTKQHESTGEYLDNTAITARVKTRLLQEQSFSSFNIKVKSYKGVVQLSGFVDTPAQAKKAERIAATVPNVKKIVNNLLIKN